MANNPKFTVLFETMRGTTFELDRDVMSIGRRDGMDICIKEPSLSSHHADLIRSLRDGKVVYVLRDNGSTNGTKVNAEPITERELKSSDLILFGNVEVLYDSNDVQLAAAGTVTHTIDLSKVNNTQAIGKVANLNPFAEAETQKRANIQKVTLGVVIAFGAAALGIAVYAIAQVFGN